VPDSETRSATVQDPRSQLRGRGSPGASVGPGFAERRYAAWSDRLGVASRVQRSEPAFGRSQRSAAAGVRAPGRSASLGRFPPQGRRNGSDQPRSGRLEAHRACGRGRVRPEQPVFRRPSRRLPADATSPRLLAIRLGKERVGRIHDSREARGDGSDGETLTLCAPGIGGSTNVWPCHSAMVVWLDGRVA
jgi:hypothetical protein